MYVELFAYGLAAVAILIWIKRYQRWQYIAWRHRNPTRVERFRAGVKDF